jgi:hypothetical protein
MSTSDSRETAILKKSFHNIDFSKVCGILGLHGGEYERNDFVEYWAE